MRRQAVPVREQGGCAAACKWRLARRALTAPARQCDVLDRAFPCERGCVMVLGDDIPNYVSNPRNAEHHGRCLVTELRSTCDAKHWSTSRMCPCV